MHSGGCETGTAAVVHFGAVNLQMEQMRSVKRRERQAFNRVNEMKDEQTEQRSA